MKGTENVTDESDWFGWIVGAGGTIVGALASVVVAFHRQIIGDYKEKDAKNEAKIALLEKRADECESDREELRIKHAVLEERVTKLEGNHA